MQPPLRRTASRAIARVLAFGLPLPLPLLLSLSVLSTVGCAASQWTELESMDALKARFNEDADYVRVVVLLSPT